MIQDRFLPLVSMLIPSFNHAGYIKECIESVMAQDYPEIELLIIDDGSTDGSPDVIASLVPQCRNRFKRFEFRPRENRGLALTINEGIAWADGTYFAAIASDDLLLPSKTRTLVAPLGRDASLAGVFGGCEFISEDGSPIGRLSPVATTCSFEDVILHRSIIVAPCQLLQLQAVRDVGPYPTDLYIEDWYMWLALTHAGKKLQVIPDVLVRYRQHATNISKNAPKMFEARKKILGTYRDHPLYPRSMAQIFVTAAIDSSSVDRRQTWHLLKSALAEYPPTIASGDFISAFLRFCAPRFVVRRLARARVWVRANLIRFRQTW